MTFISAIILFLLVFAYDAQCISLSGKWGGYILPSNITVYSQNEGVRPFQAEVPGGVYTDLVRARIIPENLIEDNDVNNRWVSNHSFTFIKHFDVDEEFLRANNATLTFHGIDTFATIFVNDYLIGKTSNMFVRYRYNVREHLEIGTNELKVVIESPVQKANELYKKQSSDYVVPPECVPEIYNGECHVNHIRKMQASFAWDWGPAFPSIGIWKDVELEVVEQVLLADVTVDLYRANNHSWNVVITAYLTTTSNEGNNISRPTAQGKIRALIAVNGNNTVKNESDISLPLNGQTFKEARVLTVDDLNVDRWWPNGYGDQPLYHVRVEIELPGSKMLRRDLNIGFRTVELVQEPLTKGDSFYFKINGVPIFAKGSNWIPSSVFPELSANRETIDHLLKSAKLVHMNMLRVWGGGFYESSDVFYEIADRYGIMIWQDFMFACGMYPTTKEFLQSVREEVKQNVLRLQYHPSIVIWAGNNENEAALYGNWYGTRNETIYNQDYIKLYVDVIKAEVERLDPTTPFVVSSPSDGAFTEKHNYLGPNPYSNLYGDVHYYNYIRNGWNINQYPRTRFASEYGVQSIPSISTLETATANVVNLSINSTFMKHRQHLIGGYEAMEHLVSQNLLIPQTNDLTSYIYLTQVNQAVSIKIETESYRQAKSELNSLGEGMTMGALYWQLNDVWQAPSWSSIEFGGRWKMLHYYAAEFFAPVIITPHVSPADEVELYIVSDQLTEIRNCSVTLNTYKWNSLSPIHTEIYRGITIPSNAAKMVASFWLDDYLQKAGCGSLATSKKKCVIEFVLEDGDGRLGAPRNYVYPAPLKSVALPSANVSLKVAELWPGERNQTEFSIELRSNEIALFVWLDFRSNFPTDGQFSHNGFHMFHGVITVTFHSKRPTTVDTVKEYLRVTTLSDIYN